MVVAIGALGYFLGETVAGGIVGVFIDSAVGACLFGELIQGIVDILGGACCRFNS